MHSKKEIFNDIYHLVAQLNHIDDSERWTAIIIHILHYETKNN